MTLDLVLRIIELSLQVVLEAMRGMTDEQKQRMWARHDERMEFWHGLAKNLMQAGAAPHIAVAG